MSEGKHDDIPPGRYGARVVDGMVIIVGGEHDGKSAGKHSGTIYPEDVHSVRIVTKDEADKIRAAEMGEMTPGPWIVDKYVQSQVRQPNGSKRRRIVCPPDADGMSDARAISAVPDMVEALQRLADRCDMVLRGVAEQTELFGLVAEAREALKNAGVAP